MGSSTSGMLKKLIGKKTILTLKEFACVSFVKFLQSDLTSV